MKIEDFKNITNLEPVIIHTDNGRRGKKNRRVTKAATVVDDKLIVAKSVCGDLDQFRKSIGVSHALGRLTSAITNLNKGQFANKVKSRYEDRVEILPWPLAYDHKKVLQVLEYVK